MARLLIEDVTMSRGTQVALGIRLRGGATQQLTVPLEPRSCERYRTPNELIAEIDTLLDSHTDGEVAAILNERGRGLLDLNEMAQRLGVSPGTVKKWRDRSRLVAHASE